MNVSVTTYSDDNGDDTMDASRSADHGDDQNQPSW